VCRRDACTTTGWGDGCGPSIVVRLWASFFPLIFSLAQAFTPGEIAVKRINGQEPFVAIACAICRAVGDERFLTVKGSKGASRTPGVNAWATEKGQIPTNPVMTFRKVSHAAEVCRRDACTTTGAVRRILLRSFCAVVALSGRPARASRIGQRTSPAVGSAPHGGVAMAIFECPCGMVVSTPACQTRCIRCGTVLGPHHLLRVASSATATADDRDASGMTAAAKDERPPHHDERSVIATYVSLVVIAAARGLCERSGTA